LLFIVNKSPYQTDNLKSCLKLADRATPVLLYEDAVFGAASGTILEPMIREALKKHEVYALEPDLKARAVDKLIDGVKVIDYPGFVTLVEKHNVCSW